MYIVQYYYINIVNCKNTFSLSVYYIMYYDIYIEKLIKVIIIFGKQYIHLFSTQNGQERKNYILFR